MRRNRRDGKRERGQILVLFELTLIIILGFAAMVIDLGVLRNNRQILVNTLDAAALSGGSVLPVDGTLPADDPHSWQSAHDMIVKNIQANYPGLVEGSGYTITYRCLVGADPTTGAPLISRDIPSVCDPHNALGHVPLGSPPVYAVTSDFTGAGPTRISACDPKLGDKCNVVVITGSAITDYVVAPVVGVNSGSTGSVVSAACKGPCGAAPEVPVDLVIILDRTLSMADNNYSNTTGPKIQALRTAANAVLSVYNPDKQRVALALTGPGSVDPATGSPLTGNCPPPPGGSGGTAYGTANDDNFFPTTTLSGSSTNLAGVAASTTLAGATASTTLVGAAFNTTLSTAAARSSTSIKVNSASGFPAAPFTIQVDNETMQVTGKSGTTLSLASRTTTSHS